MRICIRAFPFFLTLSIFHLWLNQNQYGSVGQLLVGLINGSATNTFESTLWFNASLPRLAMVILVGATLGLTGSLLQQLTLNRMISPFTFGTASGAWLGIIVLHVVAPSIAGEWQVWSAMLGALFALALVLSLTGMANLNGMQVVLAGMVVNMLLMAIAKIIVILNREGVDSLLLWGIGDLAQNGWQRFWWVAPKLFPAVLLLIFAPRVLKLLNIGVLAASARGVNVRLAFFSLAAIGVWLASVVVTAVGIIGFIGLIAPNLARALGVNNTQTELLVSMFLGALLLMLADVMAIFASYLSFDVVPTGLCAAIAGVPVFIVLMMGRLRRSSVESLKLVNGSLKLSNRFAVILVIFLVCTVAVSLITNFGSGSFFQLQSDIVLSLRWPRIVTAIAAGAALAVAGVLLQRLVYNPLASPDILGVSEGAVLAVLLAGFFSGQPVFELGIPIAFLGSMLALALVLLICRHFNYASSEFILVGLCLSSLMQLAEQYVVSLPGEGKFILTHWLAGSTYRANESSAFMLAMASVILMFSALALSRWLTLISCGRLFAQARGVNTRIAFPMILVIIAALTASVTAIMGPISFIGLIAPHLAIFLGAREVKKQILMSALLGGLLLLFADLVGQMIIYPKQIAAGVLVSIFGGIYFFLLLVRRQSV